MKRLLLLCMITSLFFGHLVAQELPEEKREEKIQSLEIAFISRKLSLTPDEAQRFWPVYNEYKKEVRQTAQLQKNSPDRDVLDFEQRMIDIRKKYRDQFAGAIGKERMNRFFKAEHEFRAVLLNRIKNQSGRENRPPMNREKRFRN